MSARTTDRWMCSALLVLLAAESLANQKPPMHMVRNPQPLMAPLGERMTFECETNIKPRSFQWRYYPLGPELATRTNGPVDLAGSRPIYIDQKRYKTAGAKSTLSLEVNSTQVAGDYQCLANYEALILASIPGRLSIAQLGEFPKQQIRRTIDVSVNDTVAFRCQPPDSNPPAAISYCRDKERIDVENVLPSGTLVLDHLKVSDSGRYTCQARNYYTLHSVNSTAFQIDLVVHRQRIPLRDPYFVTEPSWNYTVTRGSSVFLECPAVRNFSTRVEWRKIDSSLPYNRTLITAGGLKILDVQPSDEGVYVCRTGDLRRHITLMYNRSPGIREESFTPDIKEGEEASFRCSITGTPEPLVSWLLNGRTIVNDTSVEAIAGQIYFRPMEKRHAGILQCFASNVVGTAYGSFLLEVIPRQISGADYNNYEETNTTPGYNSYRSRGRGRAKGKGPKKEHKGSAKMIPPSKPSVTRLSDSSVMVRWTVPENDGLPILFFKVQYREFGQINGSGHMHKKRPGWKTTNDDIAPHVNNFEVSSLKPDHIYKFRIAAVYSNNDNKQGPTSDKYHLRRSEFYNRNVLPTPRLSHAEAVNSTSIKIYWEYEPNNVSVDGFYIYYEPASTINKYLEDMAGGEGARTHIITHLQPDTSYDIKIKSFTATMASNFSFILQHKTLPAVEETPSSTETTTYRPAASPSNIKWYIIVGVVVASVSLVVGVRLLIFFCVKKKEKTKPISTDNGDDKIAGVNEDVAHHIQADGNGYLVGTKPMPLNRTIGNGHLPQAMTITITSNPLAEADDNQNQNMIEMSCLSVAQHNNKCVDHKQQQNNISGRNNAVIRPVQVAGD